MKYKSLFIVLSILVTLLLYNLFCYSLVNRNVKIASKYVLDNYFTDDVKYDYVMATNNKDESINVYVKANKVYYHFVMIKNGNNYAVKEVNDNIPGYVLNKI